MGGSETAPARRWPGGGPLDPGRHPKTSLKALSRAPHPPAYPDVPLGRPGLRKARYPRSQNQETLDGE